MPRGRAAGTWTPEQRQRHGQFQRQTWAKKNARSIADITVQASEWVVSRFA